MKSLEVDVTFSSCQFIGGATTGPSLNANPATGTTPVSRSPSPVAGLSPSSWLGRVWSYWTWMDVRISRRWIKGFFAKLCIFFSSLLYQASKVILEEVLDGDEVAAGTLDLIVQRWIISHISLRLFFSLLLLNNCSKTWVCSCYPLHRAGKVRELLRNADQPQKPRLSRLVYSREDLLALRRSRLSRIAPPCLPWLVDAVPMIVREVRPQTTRVNPWQAHCLVSPAPTLHLLQEITKRRKFVIQGFIWLTTVLVKFLHYCKPKWHNKAIRWELVLA
jgi:hypothetical protein